MEQQGARAIPLVLPADIGAIVAAMAARPTPGGRLRRAASALKRGWSDRTGSPAAWRVEITGLADSATASAAERAAFAQVGWSAAAILVVAQFAGEVATAAEDMAAPPGRTGTGTPVPRAEHHPVQQAEGQLPGGPTASHGTMLTPVDLLASGGAQVAHALLLSEMAPSPHAEPAVPHGSTSASGAMSDSAVTADVVAEPERATPAADPLPAAAATPPRAETPQSPAAPAGARHLSDVQVEHPMAMQPEDTAGQAVAEHRSPPGLAVAGHGQADEVPLADQAGAWGANPHRGNAPTDAVPPGLEVAAATHADEQGGLPLIPPPGLSVAAAHHGDGEAETGPPGLEVAAATQADEHGRLPLVLPPGLSVAAAHHGRAEVAVPAPAPEAAPDMTTVTGLGPADPAQAAAAARHGPLTHDPVLLSGGAAFRFGGLPASDATLSASGPDITSGPVHGPVMDLPDPVILAAPPMLELALPDHATAVVHAAHADHPLR